MERRADRARFVQVLQLDDREYDLTTIEDNFEKILEFFAKSPASTRDLNLYRQFTGMLWKSKKYDQALSVLEKARDKYPKDQDLKLMQGEILTDAKHPRQAVAIFQELHKKHPGTPAIMEGLAEALYRSGDLSGAREILLEALELDTWDPAYLMLQFDMAQKLARIHYDQGEYEQALEYLEDIIAIGPRSSKWQLYFKVLDKLNRREDLKQARDIYEKIKKGRKYQNRALRYENQQRFELALTNYEKAIGVNPLEPHYYFSMGACLESLPEDEYEYQLEEATEYYRTAWEMFPNNAFYAISYVGNLTNTGQYEEALKVTRQSAEKLPQLMLPNLRYLTLMLADEGRYIEILEEMIEKDPRRELSELRTELAIIFKERNDPRSEEWFREASCIYRDKMSQEPYNWRHHYDYGNCLYETGDISGARESLFNALNLHGGFSVDISEKLSDVLMQLGEYKDALVLLEALVLGNPSDFEYVGKMGLCFLALGDYEKGFEAFNRAVMLNRAYPEYLYGAAVCAARLNLTREATNIIRDLLEINQEFIEIIEGEEAFRLMKDADSLQKVIEAKKAGATAQPPGKPSIQLKRISISGIQKRPPVPGGR